MAKWVHFVVAVNIDSDEVVIDDDTFTAKFTSGGLYDDQTNQWRDEDEEEGEKARQALSKAPLYERVI